MSLGARLLTGVLDRGFDLSRWWLVSTWVFGSGAILDRRAFSDVVRGALTKASTWVATGNESLHGDCQSFRQTRSPSSGILCLVYVTCPPPPQESPLNVMKQQGRALVPALCAWTFLDLFGAQCGNVCRRVQTCELKTM